MRLKMGLQLIFKIKSRILSKMNWSLMEAIEAQGCLKIHKTINLSLCFRLSACLMFSFMGYPSFVVSLWLWIIYSGFRRFLIMFFTWIIPELLILPLYLTLELYSVDLFLVGYQINVIRKGHQLGYAWLYWAFWYQYTCIWGLMIFPHLNSDPLCFWWEVFWVVWITFWQWLLHKI